MTQEDKELLLKDLCARLPYGFEIKCGGENFSIIAYNGQRFIDPFGEEFWIESIKPYLRSMSNMTEEEKEEYLKLWNLQDEFSTDADIRFKIDVIDWLNAHHFDYRGLIEKGLALEAPEDMYKTE